MLLLVELGFNPELRTCWTDTRAHSYQVQVFILKLQLGHGV